ncbi:MAG: WG repeat-containing protein [Moraxella sp.]|nr:WG repeat-containing protein [Moraxella sp.]
MKILKLLALSVVMMAASAQACDRPPLGDYDWVGCVQDGMAISYKDTHHGLVDADGRSILTPKYRHMARLNDKLFRVSDGEKYGLIDRSGKVVLPMDYDAIMPDTDDTYAIWQNHKLGLMDNDGNILIPPKYEHFKDVGGLIITRDNPTNATSRLFGVLDYQENVIIPFEYEDIESFADYFLATKDNQVRLIDRQHRLIERFDEFKRTYPDEYLMVKRDGKWGVIDSRRQKIIPFEYDDIDNITEELFPVAKNDKWGVVDKQNKVVVDFEYDAIHEFKDGLAAAIKDDKYGYIDQTGKVVVDFDYKLAFGFNHGLAEVANRVESLDKHDESQSSMKYGVIDKTGKSIIPPEYDSVLIPFYKNDGRIHVQLGEKYGVFNIDGKPIIDIVYDNISFFDEGRVEVSKDGKGFYIDEQGRQIGGSWLIHEQACRHVEAGQRFEVMFFRMIPIPFEVVSVDVERGKVMVKELLGGEVSEVVCGDIPTAE